MTEQDLYWAIRSAQYEGISVDKFLQMVRETWREVRAEMTHIENQKLARASDAK